MIQSRFFHSSLKEIELNIKEIYSLQSELRKRVLATTIKSAKIIPVQTTSFKGLDAGESSSAFSAASKKDEPFKSVISKNTHFTELSKQKLVSSQEKIDQGNIRQASARFVRSDPKNKSTFNGTKKGTQRSNDYLKEVKKINTILIFILVIFVFGSFCIINFSTVYSL